MKCDHIPISVSISVGLACCDNAPDEEVDALIKRADKNLYLAKQKRNTVFGL
jgi:PleD family two-component response regulator